MCAVEEKKTHENPTRETELSDVFFSFPVMDVFEVLGRGTDKREEE